MTNTNQSFTEEQIDELGKIYSKSGFRKYVFTELSDIKSTLSQLLQHLTTIQEENNKVKYI